VVIRAENELLFSHCHSVVIRAENERLTFVVLDGVNEAVFSDILVLFIRGATEFKIFLYKKILTCGKVSRQKQPYFDTKVSMKRTG